MAKNNTVRTIIPAGFDWTAQNEIDQGKVEAIRAHLRAGGSVPPVVVAQYKGFIMPIDGHHRTAAHDAEGLPLDAYVIKGAAYERLTRIHYRDTNCIFCDGVAALEVAERIA
jgi:ParB-like chromosome segregation protein Spo0J